MGTGALSLKSQHKGTLTTVHSFDSTDGQFLPGGLIQATDGKFYGMTNGGGANGDGTIFSLSVGLGPFVETLPILGKVGGHYDIGNEPHWYNQGEL